jgi:hypothetical protein
MTAPYIVWIDDFGDHTHIPCATLVEAIERAKLVPPHQTRRVRVIGDGYDCDCDAEGYFECNDGLTEDERGLVEAAGF